MGAIFSLAFGQRDLVVWVGDMLHMHEKFDIQVSNVNGHTFIFELFARLFEFG